MSNINQIVFETLYGSDGNPINNTSKFGSVIKNSFNKGRSLANTNTNKIGYAKGRSSHMTNNTLNSNVNNI